MSTDLIERTESQPQPMSIIATAVANGADPDQLSKLLDLQERYEKNEARKAYNKAMRACQEEMPAVVKDSENSHTRSRYASLEAVSKAIKPICAKHGFSLSYGEGVSTVADHILIICKCMHEAGHTEEFTLSCPYDTTGAKGGATKTGIQGMGSSVSYGRRYLKLMIFDVTVADEDDDGNKATVAKISETEVQELDHWLSQLNADDQAKFFDYIGVRQLEDIVAADWGKALSALQRKVKAVGK